MKIKFILCVLSVFAILPLNAHADSIPYDNIGTENSVTYSFTAEFTGDINAYYWGSTASLENTLSLLVNGVVTPETSMGVLNNRTSTLGQFVKLGTVNAGDQLTFRLNVVTTKEWFYSDKLLNADLINHVYSANFSGNQSLGLAAGTYIAFEDLYGGGDFNYHDENFVFTNIITTAVPEPTTYAMMLAGLGLVGLTSHRRKHI